MVRDIPDLPQFKDGCYFITNGSASSGPLTTWTQGIGFNLRPASGSIDIKITEEMTFQMNCRASIRNVGAQSELLTIKLTPPPVVSLSVNRGGGTGGDFYAINWGSQGALTCTASGEGATALGWKTNGKTSADYGTDRMYGSASAINSVPGKTFTLSCTGVGGTTVVNATFSKNSDRGVCVNGTYYAGSTSWPDNHYFGDWLVAESKKHGLESVYKDLYLALFQVYKDEIVAGKTDSQIKSELATKIQTALSGNWNYCN